MPYRTPSGALYDSGDYEACLDQRARAGASTKRSATASPARGRGTARRRRARVRRRALDLEHGLHHARADGRRADGDAAEVGQRGGRVRHGRSARRISVRLGRRRRVRVTGRFARRWLPTSSAAHRGRDGLSELDTATTPWTVASGNYSSRFSGSASGRFNSRRGASARRSTRSASTSASPSCRCARWRGWPTGTPRGCPRRWSRTSRRSPSGRPRTSTRRTRGPRRVLRRARLHRRRLRRRDRRETGAVEIVDYVTVHDAGVLLNPLLADGQILGGLAHGAAPPSSSATSTTNRAAS